jgi:pimeloyl-ACP methyl ester carboxylesterase
MTACQAARAATPAYRGRLPKVLGRALRESAAVARLVAAQYRRPPIPAEPIDCGPVMVLPGFTMSDFHTWLLRRTLRACGVQAVGWGQGINTGLKARDFEELAKRIDDLAGMSGRKVVLIGWSLGGLYAAELANHMPDRIDMVVTLGTPFALRASICPGPIPARPAVHTVACWSTRDEIVPSHSAAGWERDANERVELRCTHSEMVSDPGALRSIATLLKKRANHA